MIMIHESGPDLKGAEIETNRDLGSIKVSTANVTALRDWLRDDPMKLAVALWSDGKKTLRETLKAAGEPEPPEIFDSGFGLREPVNDRERASLDRWNQIENERWSAVFAPYTPAQRALRNRLRKLGLIETAEHARNREFACFGPKDGTSNLGGGFVISARHDRRLDKKIRRQKWEEANPERAAALAIREAPIKERNKLIAKFIAFRNAFNAASPELRLELADHVRQLPMVLERALR